MKILTPEQIREVDRLTTEKYGIPSIILMENAGMRVVEVLEDRFENLDELTIGILCGKGNNGGDGFVVARQLIQKGCYPFVYLFGSETDVKGDAKTNLDILKAIGYPPTIITEEHDWDEEKLELLDADIIIDGLLGTGAKLPLNSLYQTVVETLMDDFPRAKIVSIDVPTPGVEPDVTVTFSALKPPLVFTAHHGEVILADIGNPPDLLESSEFKLHLIEPHDLPRRLEETNKGTYGKVLVVGGSRGKSGAAAMAGQAALRAGAGLVTVATGASVLPIVAASMPELMTESLEETSDGAIANQTIHEIVKGKTILAIGPGIGRHPETIAFVRSVVTSSPVSVVLDADGIAGFATNDKGVVVTPHPGEMAQLIKKDVAYVAANRLDVARNFATENNVYVVLKGFRTLIATPDGSVFVNPTGNPGMASGGTGDILTGMIAGILAQEHLGDFVQRLCLAVYLHGLAGDLAAAEVGEQALIATDILRFLPQAWHALDV